MRPLPLAPSGKAALVNRLAAALSGQLSEQRLGLVVGGVPDGDVVPDDGAVESGGGAEHAASVAPPSPPVPPERRAVGSGEGSGETYVFTTVGQLAAYAIAHPHKVDALAEDFRLWLTHIAGQPGVSNDHFGWVDDGRHDVLPPLRLTADGSRR